jgi:hypothetical protein
MMKMTSKRVQGLPAVGPGRPAFGPDWRRTGDLYQRTLTRVRARGASSTAISVAVELYWLIEADSCGMQQRFGTGIRNNQPEIHSNQPENILSARHYIKSAAYQPEIRSNQPGTRSNQPERSQILDRISQKLEL